MSNQDIQATWQYHNGTKHPNGSLLRERYRYDPTDRSPLFKVYPELAPIPLPLDRSPRGVPALVAIARTIPPTEGKQHPDLDAVARLLYFSAGITKQLRTPWGTIPFRRRMHRRPLPHRALPRLRRPPWAGGWCLSPGPA